MKEHKFRVWSNELKMMFNSDNLIFTYKNGEIINIGSTLVNLTAPLSDYVLEGYVEKKDEYGTEIYDGDLVYFTNCYEHDVVVWSEDNLEYIFRESWESVSEFKPNELRVVGNIHKGVDGL